jgi:hypothetical protein
MQTAPKIALCGKLKSGKTTLALELSSLLGVPRDSFAAALKAGLKMMGIVPDGPNKNREALQYVGVKLRELDANHWIKVLAAKYPDLDNTGLIVDDCRFQNEYQWLKDSGFLMVRIKVRSDTQIMRGAAYSQLFHQSEIALDPIPDRAFDIVLDEYTEVPDRVGVILAALESSRFSLVGGD